jgi:hypothetical protein
MLSACKLALEKNCFEKVKNAKFLFFYFRQTIQRLLYQLFSKTNEFLAFLVLTMLFFLDFGATFVKLKISIFGHI